MPDIVLMCVEKLLDIWSGRGRKRRPGLYFVGFIITLKIQKTVKRMQNSLKLCFRSNTTGK